MPKKITVILVEHINMSTFAAPFKKAFTMRINTNSPSNKAFTLLTAIFLMVFMIIRPQSATASDDSHGEHKEPLNAGKLIVDHIMDAHSIHFFGHVSMPLPVILYTDKGIDIFMAGKLMDDHHVSTPYTSPKTGYTYYNNKEKIVILNAIPPVVDVAVDTLHTDHSHGEAEHAEAHGDSEIPAGYEVAHETLIDFSITKSVFGMLLMLAAIAFIFISIAKTYVKRKGKAPKGIQNLLEPFILFIKDEVALPAIGKKNTPKYLPFLLSVFFFIWICNLLGLVPFLGGFNITGTLSITAVLAVMVFLITSFSGNKHYWGHIFWPPGVPFVIKLILVPIEIASVFIKPAVLMIRLTANINAGHIVILAFTTLILIFGEKSAAAGYGVGVVSTLFMVFMFFIELLVGFLQAYVFTLLTALYFGDATQEHHHEEDHH